MYGKFNIRVYGIWLDHNHIWLSKERIRNQEIIKFPGGGLEFGEGTIDCLIREWKEELNLDIQVLEHFYTTDYFQPSAFDTSQVISIYYLVSVPNPPEVICNSNANECLFALPIQELSENVFSLPIDKKVGGLLKAHLLS
jgi:8-oxo-dGTP diphosphatase